MSLSFSCFRSKGAVLLAISILAIIPVNAFTANSLDITVDRSGDAVAVLRFSFEGLLENSIPQSILEEELTKGLVKSSEPPQLISVDSSSATILLKKFASVDKTEQGTEYRTVSMDFKKVEIALKNSALSSVVTADFSPAKIVVSFPDSFRRDFNEVDSLPSIVHIDPGTGTSGPATAPADTVTIEITTSPDKAQIFIDGTLRDESPATIHDISVGPHLVSIRKAGFEPIERDVEVKRGEILKINGYLVYLTPAPQPIAYPLSGFGWGLSIFASGCICLLIIMKIQYNAKSDDM